MRISIFEKVFNAVLTASVICSHWMDGVNREIIPVNHMIQQEDYARKTFLTSS